MEKYFLGIDIGSSGLKCTLLSGSGKIVGPFTTELCTISKKVGWAEQDPDSWYETLCDMLPKIFRETAILPEQIAAIAPDAATHTTVLADEKFKPVCNAIMWNDQRAADIAMEFSEKQREHIIKTTLHPPGAMWSLCQNLWVKKYNPELFGKVKRMMFAKDYLRYRLCGEYATDYIDAEGSQFYDVGNKCWSKELCDYMQFDVDNLPTIKNPTDIAGYITKEASDQTGLREGTTVLVGTTDTVMEVFAAGAIELGSSTVKLATSGRICIVTDKAYPHPQLVNYSHVIEGMWYPGTGTRSCALSFRWFKDTLCGYEKYIAKQNGENVYKILDEMAKSIPAGSEGLFYHPYLLGEFTPYSNANLRASFIGVGLKHTKAHFVRAILEGTAYSLRDCMGVLEGLSIETSGNIRLIGGGSGSPLWAQIVADVLNRPIDIPATSDSSFGSAMLAAVGVGHFNSFSQAVSKCVQNSLTIMPNLENAEIYSKLFDVYKSITAHLTSDYDKLSEILSDSK